MCVDTHSFKHKLLKKHNVILKTEDWEKYKPAIFHLGWTHCIQCRWAEDITEQCRVPWLSKIHPNPPFLTSKFSVPSLYPNRACDPEAGEEPASLTHQMLCWASSKVHWSQQTDPYWSQCPLDQDPRSMCLYCHGQYTLQFMWLRSLFQGKAFVKVN